jgi:dinuclear metal center YbgI/SA1388 family protein
MTTVAEIARYLEEFAPAQLAEPWDNVGLLYGDPDASVNRVMTCLTVTPVTAAEAIREAAELIISHHPVLFHAVKKIRADLADTGHLWSLARAGIAIASPHTAFDNTYEGINDILCRRLALTEVAPLRPRVAQAGSARTFKIVVFSPQSDHDAILRAAFDAGAGRIGAYEECSFAIPGEGTFFGTDAATPAVGQRGRRETVEELRVEVICPAAKLAEVLESIRARHSYEEPAIDVYPLYEGDGAHGQAAAVGSGRIGRLMQPSTLQEFARAAGRALGVRAVAVAGDPSRPVQLVAIACGAGDEFLTDAARANADVFLTGEARFHRAVAADASGIGLVVAGHYATERPGVEELAARIARAFPRLSVWPSRDERDPVQWLDVQKSG